MLCAGTSNIRAEIIAASHIDWSNSGSNRPKSREGGFTYGIYPAGTGTDGALSFASMQPFSDPTDAGDAADEGDPDSDGVENLLELETPVSPPGAGIIGFAYTRNKLAAGT